MVFTFLKESSESDAVDERSFTNQRTIAPEYFDRDHIDDAIFFFHPRLTCHQLKIAQQAALLNGTDVGEELIHLGFIETDLHYRHLAKTLGIDYLPRIEPDKVLPSKMLDVLLRRQGPMRYAYNDRIVILLSPKISDAGLLKRQLAQFPSLKDRIVIAAPEAIKQGAWSYKPEERLQKTLYQLLEYDPQMSAKQVLSAPQSFIIGLLLAVLVFVTFSASDRLINLVHCLMALLFFNFNLLKLASIFMNSGSDRAQSSPLSRKSLPIYTILVALYQEEDVVKQLIRALSRMDWPSGKLDIKLICEQDDPATIKALQRLKLGQQFEIVIVPKLGPRTKPKALQYALQGARGEFVTVYDAEDIPHPKQLIEAYACFQTSSEQLACLQAPLVIANSQAGWLPSLFALEYAGLFRKLLPMLASLQLPVQLGGTSNHFRTNALHAVGGWDPYNVTEDADLGIRLHRHQYRTAVLQHPTFEHAPEEFGVWLRQRTRWLKGWMQTWLVLMRQPTVAWKNLGMSGFLTLQILSGGMLAAVLVHPFAYLFVFTHTLMASLYGIDHLPVFVLWLIVIDSFNLLAGYVIFGFAGWRAFIAGEKKGFQQKWFCVIPIYWLMMSLAGWRAFYQLFANVHLWEKTPHAPMEKPNYKPH